MNTRSKKAFGESGLTLVEMMVATSLLVVMMLGLTAMFNQTQRAFRSGLKQVDVFEGGRAVMDLVGRDLEQVADTHVLGITNLFLQSVAGDVKQSVPVNLSRTNQLFDLFFMSSAPPNWTGIGYAISNAPSNGGKLGVGALYRWERSTNALLDSLDLNFAERFTADVIDATARGTWTNFNRVADGVIHFKIRALNENAEEYFANTAADPVSFPFGVFTNSFPTLVPTNRTDGLPYIVEVELGILEPQTLEQARSIPDANRDAYLEKQAGKVHIFRQQIPIRNAPR